MVLIAAAALIWFSVPLAVALTPALRGRRPEIGLSLRYLWLAGLIAALGAARHLDGGTAGGLSGSYFLGLDGRHFLQISGFVLVHALFAGLLLWLSRARVRLLAGAQFWIMAAGLFLVLAPLIAFANAPASASLDDTTALLRRASAVSTAGTILIAAAMFCHAAALPVALWARLGNRRAD